MKKINIQNEDLVSAWYNWAGYFGRGRTNIDIFFDFIDPVRQTNIREYMCWEKDHGYIIFECRELNVPTQVGRRIELLKGPYYLPYWQLTPAHQTAIHSWGKKDVCDAHQRQTGGSPE